MSERASAPIHDLNEPADAELIRLVLGGDARAWGPLVERYKRLVYSIPRRYGLPDDACDDVFQNTFMQLFRELAKIRDAATLPKWLMTTTHRECWRTAKARRAAAGSGDIPDIAADAPPAHRLETWERQHLVHLALERLGGRCEALLRAVFLDPAAPSYQHISERLGMPIGSIGPVRARCLEKLVQLLPKDLIRD